MQNNLHCLPVFVYGTLRNGQANYRRFLQGRTVREEQAQAPNHVMYNDGLAYVADHPTHTVVGEVMWIIPHCALAVIAQLDRLEGYQTSAPETSFYVRVMREIVTDTGERLTVWMYHAGPGTLRGLSECSIVPGGDWLDAADLSWMRS